MRYLSLFSALAIFNLILTFSTFSKDPGDMAEDFSLSSTDGKTYSLYNDLKAGKTVVVMFWSTTCPNVQPYHDRVKDLYNNYSGKGFTFWAVNSNVTESLDEVSSHAKKNGYPFPMLKDTDNKVADMLGAQRTPEVYVISKDKVILYHGRIDDNKNKSDVTVHDLQNALDEISANKEVSVKTTKIFGCTIKRVGQDN